MANSAIRIKNLGKSFKKGLKHRKVVALKDLTLTVNKGEVFGFIGSNGAGKSTTIKILMGLLRPSRGEACFFETPVGNPMSRKRVGYLSEHPKFYDYLNPRELLNLLGSVRGLDAVKIRARSDQLFELVELQDAAARKIGGFSKGMVQRLGIAAALFDDPELLLLDEPMSGLDPLGRHLVASLIRDLQGQGKTIFFSTHIIPDVENLCDRVGIIVNGTMKYVGSIEQALYPPGGDLELTFRIDPSKNAGFAEENQLPSIWQKEGKFKTALSESRLPDIIRKILDNGGSIISVEPEKRSLEELYLALTDDYKATT